MAQVCHSQQPRRLVTDSLDAMAFELCTPPDAARFVSPAFADAESVALVRDLLRAASGDGATAQRTVTARHFELLSGHRVISLIPSDWTVDLPDAEVANVRRNLALWRLNLWAVCESVVAQLAEGGVESRVLKGLATSRLDYPRPELRDTGDVDLLVWPDQLDHAIDLLHAIGCVNHSPDHEDLDLGKGRTLLHPRRAQIDLHTRLNIYKRQDVGILMANPEPIPNSIGLAMPVELRLIHAISHLVYTPPGGRRLSGLADVSAIVARYDIDWDKVRRLAAELNIESLSGFGLRVEALLHGRSGDHCGAWAPPSNLERWSFARAERALLMEKALAFSNLGSMGAKARYLRQWTLPSRELLEARGGWREYYGKMLPAWLGGQGAHTLKRRGLR